MSASAKNTKISAHETYIAATPLYILKIDHIYHTKCAICSKLYSARIERGAAMVFSRCWVDAVRPCDIRVKVGRSESPTSYSFEISSLID
jgi:hypothetical protein